MSDRDSEMDGRVVVVTGASRGIGRGCVDVLLRAGAEVVGCDLEAEPEGRIAASHRDRYRHVVADVSVAAELEAAIEGAASELGRLDGLVNNAGSHPPTQPIDAFSVEDFQRLVDLNLKSVFVGCRTALPHIRKRRGAIVNMGSAVGVNGQEGAVTYCLTKGAIGALSKALAIDEAPYGVRVNTVCPGAIATPLAAAVVPEEVRSVVASWSWHDRWGTPEEVGELVRFLLGDAAGFVTGQDIFVAGGTELGFGIKGRPYYEAMGLAQPSPAPAPAGREGRP